MSNAQSNIVLTGTSLVSFSSDASAEEWLVCPLKEVSNV